MITPLFLGLPDNYWEFIELNYKDYTSCELVAESNDLAKFLEGYTDIEDLSEFILAHPNPQYQKTLIDVHLYISALEDRIAELENKL